ncbi:transposase [Collimonas humicola]|uniref:transposase n=1 Tax=Collimonas humicola TaxID=2825886 RepID=UPI001B8AD280|nr:transposase [Collimonas humicola]
MDELHKCELKLRDDQWLQLEPLMIGKASDPGMCGRNNRLFMEAILWMVENKGLWHRIPSQFGKWNATYMRFRRWTESNFWRFLTQSGIEDPGLRLMLGEIADYADLYTRRRELRRVRKNYKKLYMAE